MKQSWLLPLLLLPTAASAAPDVPHYDIIIRGGTIQDGTGKRGFAGDVAVAGDRIAEIGDLGGATAETVIDARGQFVSPGFISVHSHAIRDAVARSENMLRQGVTTEIINADGGYSGIGGEDIVGQLADFAKNGLAVNLGAYVGFNNVWQAVVGEAERRPTPAQIAEMRGLVRRNLAAGAWGVGAGLDYKPAYFATRDEVIRIVSPAREWRTLFSNHDRVTPPNFSSIAGIDETIAIGKGAGLVPVVTHIKLWPNEMGRARDVVETMRASTRAGDYVAADIYPYIHANTYLGALIIPSWAQEGGRDALLKRLADPAQRARIAEETTAAIKARAGGPDGLFLPSKGKELTDYMREVGSTDATETVLKLVETENPFGIFRFGSEEDLTAFLQYPDTAIACDCGSTNATKVHPRNYGAFPRAFGRYVRERGALSWEEAVRKATALPAAMLGMVDRGTIAPGMIADLTVFDPKTIIDKATFVEPAQFAVGVSNVLVNGRPAILAGALTEAKTGRRLFRAGDMPTYRMDAADRGLTVRSFSITIDGIRYKGAIALKQAADDRLASGTLALASPTAKLSLAGAGPLFTAPGWSAFTGRLSNGEAITVTLDTANPAAANKGRQLTVRIGDRSGATFLP
ncbi:MAG: N-acyl-D-amino-acid deacylase family protein [Sphingobium sp.]